MLTKEDILKNILKRGEQIRSYGVKRIGLFGSLIRKEQKEGSDVDILVEFKEDMKSFDNYMELKFFLEELLGCTVDQVVYEALKPRIKPYMMREVEYAEGL